MYRHRKGHFPPKLEAGPGKPNELVAGRLRSFIGEAVGDAGNGLVDICSRRLISPAGEVNSPAGPFMAESSRRNGTKRRSRIGRRNAGGKWQLRIGGGWSGVCGESSVVFSGFCRVDEGR